MKFILILLCSLSFFTCSRQSRKDYRYAANGLIYKTGSNELFTGQITDTADVIITFEVVKGIKHGRFITYYTNGSIEKIGWIRKNNNEGEWRYFYPSGELECVGYYVNDIPHGKWERFYKNGSLKETGNYKRGVQDGEWKSFTPSAELKEHLLFRNGKMIDLIMKSI